MNETQRCAITDVVQHMVNPKNVDDPDQYVVRTLNGNSFGIESQINFQYCCGGGYAKGIIGDQKFGLYYNRVDGFTLHWYAQGNNTKGYSVKNLRQDQDLLLLQLIKDKVVPFTLVNKEK